VSALWEGEVKIRLDGQDVAVFIIAAWAIIFISLFIKNHPPSPKLLGVENQYYERYGK